ncbi:serine hydrolase [Nonomuraea sp. NEAU-A123]|uniref:serine hydrolase domain-containing protein n=1 Tax=Nonomuraea sp. NEAU-A123 TaxID=2839649 RepID=UPI001BE44961|nr:serine hydrolase domain-containing protein [Nonomuraea sp. NEAU-A123]MBT2235162.1 beta-lactamase family protein [Nonomuraea sp. NEAU-A123]
MVDLAGTYTSRFARLAEEFAGQLDSDGELGASIAVVHEGELVVDIWGGWMDEARRTPWAEDTITCVWSSTKTVMALAALMLVDRGLLDVREKVATYWPEFAAAGKQDIEVRHLLAHTSGLPAWDQPVTLDDLYDWDRSTARLAAQAPWWEPGTASGYHALSQGHLVGEVLRRITGRSLKEFVAYDIASVLDADFSIGVPRADYGRVANIVPPPPRPVDLTALDPAGVTFRALTSPAPDAAASWSDEWRAADIGSGNGHTNARALALIQSAMSHGGVARGHRLLSPETIELVFDEQASGVDLVLGAPRRFGVGFGLTMPEVLPYLPESKICFWGGWGGSIVVNDLDRNLTIAYVMNRMDNANTPGVIGTRQSIAYVTTAFDCAEGRR